MKILVALLFLLGLTSSSLGYNATASPNCSLRILDQDGKPVAGLKVEREWKCSDKQSGSEEATTDTEGNMRFKKVVIRRSAIKRVFKPLLIFVPASCGPEWETYSFTQFKIHWSGAYDLKFPASEYKHVNEVFQDKEGTCVRDPKVFEDLLRTSGRDLNQNHIEIYFFDRTKNFDLTLKVFKRSREQ